MGNGQVWAGSFGIYVIDSETITCNKVLNDHSDLVVDSLLRAGIHDKIIAKINSADPDQTASEEAV